VNIEKIGKGTFEIERITIDLTNDDKAEFLRDPELFLSKALEAKKETVNDFSIGARAMEAMKQQVKNSPGPITPLVVLTVHAEAPPEYASRRYAVTIPDKKK
jgi:hypothetical protein